MALDSANPRPNLRNVPELVSPSSSHRFGRFELRPSERVLLADGTPVAIGARAFDLLIAFVDRPGTLITKDDLLATVWPGLVVEENNLQVQVSTLRKIIGQSALATIPGRGYRFNLAVSRADADAPAPPVDDREPAAEHPTKRRSAKARTNLPSATADALWSRRRSCGNCRVAARTPGGYDHGLRWHRQDASRASGGRNAS